MQILVLETHEEDKVEWGVSFTNENPEPEDYFEMKDRETAFRLRDRLAKFAPATSYKPVALPSNKF